MSLFDNEHPQHLDYLARAKAASRRTTEMLDAADRAEDTVCPDCGGEGFVILLRPACCGNLTGSGECRAHCAIPEEYWEPCESCRGEGNICTGIAEAKAAAAIDRENRRVPWARRVAAG